MATQETVTQSVTFAAPIPDFIPLLQKIVEKTESDRIVWNGHPQNATYSTVVQTDEGLYSVRVEGEEGGVAAFAVRDEAGQNVFEWDYELEDDPGIELAEKLLRAAAENYVRRTNARLRQLAEGVDKL